MIPVTVTFYGDVGFDRSYNHVIDFSNETERENYFSPKVIKTIQDCAYNKPMNSLQIRCPYEDALNFTYCKFIIGSNPNSQKKIYAWVDDVILVTDQKDENNVFIPILQINISIDPWQTFLFNFTVGESFVAREHVDRFKVNEDGTRGWTCGNTSTEGNINALKRTTSLFDFRKEFTYKDTSDKFKVYWICLQRVLSIGSDQNRMFIYFIPFANRDGVKIAGSSSVISYDVINFRDVLQDRFISMMYIDPETVASAYLIPFDIGDFVYNSSTQTYDVSFYDGIPHMAITGFVDDDDEPLPYMAYELVTGSNIPITFSRNITLSDVGISIPNNLSPYSYTHEPQLYKEPYITVQVIDEGEISRGKLPDILVNTSSFFSLIQIQLLIDSINVRIRIKPNVSINLGDNYWVEYECVSVDVLRAQWLSYLLQERNADREMINSQINQRVIANAIGGVSSGVSMGGQQAMAVGKGQAAGNAGALALSEGGAFAAGGLLGLGVGAINTVGGYIADSHFCFEQQDIREKAIKSKANNVLQTGTLKSLRGDMKIMVCKCDDSTFDIKAKEFHKYGYSVFFYETPNLKSRKYFNFIATNLVKIEGSLNNNIKMALSEIFNNGVTIWHGDYINELTGIGDYSKENIERSLL